MSVFVTVVLVVAVVVAAALVLALVGPTRWADPTAGPVGTLPPVLLPEDPEAPDVERVRFSPALRGYRMDQVDEVLDRLAQALHERDRRIAALIELTAGEQGDRDSTRREAVADSEY